MAIITINGVFVVLPSALVIFHIFSAIIIVALSFAITLIFLSLNYLIYCPARRLNHPCKQLQRWWWLMWTDESGRKGNHNRQQLLMFVFSRITYIQCNAAAIKYHSGMHRIISSTYAFGCRQASTSYLNYNFWANWAHIGLNRLYKCI